MRIRNSYTVLVLSPRSTNRSCLCPCCSQVSDQGVLVMELASGLSFPATEYLSHVIHTQALQGNGCSVLRCHLQHEIEKSLSSTSSTSLSFTLPASVSSALCGPGLPPCERHRLLCDQRDQGPTESVQAARSATDIFQSAGTFVCKPQICVLN